MEERKLTQDEIYNQIAEWRGMTREEYDRMRAEHAEQLSRLNTGASK